MRYLHLARAAILARVTGLGESAVPFLRLGTWVCCEGIRPQSMKCFLENRSLSFLCGFGEG